MRASVGLGLVCSLWLGCTQSEPEVETPAPPEPVLAGDPVPEAGTPAPGGNIRVALAAEPKHLNPQLEPLDPWGRKIANLVYSPLAAPHPETFAPQARLAKSWDISDDRRTLTFHLRQNVRWHDGERFTAEDVVFTFEKLLDPTSRTQSHRRFLAPLGKFERLDAHTVRFHLTTAHWYAFDAIAETRIYPEHIFNKGDFNTHPANRSPVGTGPFRFQSWKPNERIVLTDHASYFGAGPHVERLEFILKPAAKARAKLARQGNVDVIEHLPPETWYSLARNPSITNKFWRLRHSPSLLQLIAWNTRHAAFRDRRVRRAVTMLLDRHAILQNFRLGLDLAAASWFYPGTRSHARGPETPLPHDPDAAQRLLERAGWVDSDADGVRDRDGKPFRFTLTYPQGSRFYEQLAATLQRDFGAAGIEVSTAKLTWQTLRRRLHSGAFDACALLWHVGPRTDPYPIWHSSAAAEGKNFTAFKNDRVDSLLEKARAALDADQRASLYGRLDALLREHQPYTLLFRRQHLSLVAKRLGGIVPTPHGVFDYARMYVRSPDSPRAPKDSPPGDQ